MPITLMRLTSSASGTSFFQCAAGGREEDVDFLAVAGQLTTLDQAQGFHRPHRAEGG
jgi:hypothetical protein